MTKPPHQEKESLESIHASEHWLHKNPKKLKTVQEGLKKKAKHCLGSFAKHLEDFDEL